jgi:hypothetical protein
MSILCGSSFRMIIVLIGLYSMCNVIEVVQGRFLWDLSLYCVNYCSRINGQTPPIGVCSCHRIASYQRRMAFNDFQTPTQLNYQNEQSIT